VLAIALLAACGPTASYSWIQPETSGIDILFVVDASSSMIEEQELLASGFTSFIHEMGSADFRVGVIDSDVDAANPDAGRLIGDPPWLTPADDYISLFETRAMVGTDGSDHEKGLEAAVVAVTQVNPDFARADASLLVVIVSDEDDCSDGGALDGQPGSACYLQADSLIPVADFVSALQDTKDNPLAVQFAAIVGPVDPCDGVAEGVRYHLATWQTAGVLGDICQADWSNLLSSLGLTASSDRGAIPMAERLVEKSVQVTVDGVEVPPGAEDGWTIDADTCVLEFHGDAVPDRGAAIAIEGRPDTSAVKPCPLNR
jgi:hypothetical protein